MLAVFIIWFISGAINIALSFRKEEDSLYWKTTYWITYGVFMLTLLEQILFS